METKTLLLHKLARAEKDEIGDQIAPLVAEVFPDLEAEKWWNSIFYSTAFFSRMYLYKADGQAVGFHVFSRHRYQNKIIFRVFSCLGEKAKGRNSLERKGLIEILRTRFRYPTQEIYFFTCYVNPIPYYVMTRSFHRAYPHFSKPTPSAYENLLVDLGDFFQFERIDGNPLFVRRTPGSPRVSQDEIDRINGSKNPAIMKFLEWCPGYLTGEGLITLAPISWGNVFISVLGKLGLRASS